MTIEEVPKTKYTRRQEQHHAAPVPMGHDDGKEEEE